MLPTQYNYFGNLEIFKYLLQQGADPNIQNFFYNMISMMPVTSGKLVLEKYEAIRIFLAYGGAYETEYEFRSKVLGRTVSKNVRYNDRHCQLQQKQILCLITISNEVP